MSKSTTTFLRKPLSSVLLAEARRPRRTFAPISKHARSLATQVDTPRSTPSGISPPPPPPVETTPESINQQERETKARKIFQDAVAATAPRNNWTKEEISAIYYQPLMELAYQAVSHPRSHGIRAGDLLLTPAFPRAPYTAASTRPARSSSAPS